MTFTVEIPTGPDAPIGSGCLMFGEEYIGVLDLPWAVRIAQVLNDQDTKSLPDVAW